MARQKKTSKTKTEEQAQKQQELEELKRRMDEM